MRSWFKQIPTTFILIVVAVSALVLMNLAKADSTSNVNVGFEQGGAQLTVKTGGQIKVRDTSLFQLIIPIADIGTSSASANGRGALIAPFAGSISSVKCIGSTTMPGATQTNIGFTINGVEMPTGAVKFSSTAAAYTAVTATPSAANTVAAGDLVTAGSDGVTTNSPVGSCTLFITP